MFKNKSILITGGTGSFEYKKKYPWYPAMINVDLPNSDLNYFTEKTFSTLKYY